MSENKDYVSQNVENGSIHISEEVVSSIVSMAVRDVEGVYGLHTNVGKKNAVKSVRLIISEDNNISIDCYIVALYGYSVVEVAKNVQEAVATTVESTTGCRVSSVNVSVSALSMPRDNKK